jgi:hypothetical protein
MTNVLTGVPEADRTLYSGEEVILSAQENVLFATSRYTEHPVVPGEASSYPNTENMMNSARSSGSTPGQKVRLPTNSRVKKKAPQAGYITAILLTSYAEHRTPLQSRSVRAGFPIRVLFQQETTTTGGLANSVSPAQWGEEGYLALADSQIGMIEVGASEDVPAEANIRRYGNWITLIRLAI